MNSKAFFMALMIATTVGADRQLRVTLLGYTNSTMNLPASREIFHRVHRGTALVPGAEKEDQGDEQVDKVEIRQPGIGRGRNGIKSSRQGHHHRDAPQNRDDQKRHRQSTLSF